MSTLSLKKHINGDLMDIHTLQDFIFQTKGIIYLLIVGYLIGFPLYWKFISARDKDKDEI